MERSAVSFDTFESVTLQGSSMRALVNLIRDYFTNRGLRAKLAVSWMILALSYVLVFPTLMSAMTGYSGTFWHGGTLLELIAANFRPALATTKAYIQAPDGSQVEWSSFRLINYIIYDGWRIGLTGSYLVTAVSRYESGNASLSLHPLPLSNAIISCEADDYFKRTLRSRSTPMSAPIMACSTEVPCCLVTPKMGRNVFLPKQYLNVRLVIAVGRGEPRKSC